MLVRPASARAPTVDGPRNTLGTVCPPVGRPYVPSGVEPSPNMPAGPRRLREQEVL